MLEQTLISEERLMCDVFIFVTVSVVCVWRLADTQETAKDTKYIRRKCADWIDWYILYLILHGKQLTFSHEIFQEKSLS